MPHQFDALLREADVQQGTYTIEEFAKSLYGTLPTQVAVKPLELIY